MRIQSPHRSQVEDRSHVRAEKVEDLYDVPEADEVMQEWLESGKQTYLH